MFRITDHIDFDRRGRAQCPVCLKDGKTAKNLALIPNTDGAYKCHRGCTPNDIRDVLGTPKTEYIPPALTTPPKKPKYHSPETIQANADKLRYESQLAKQWLHDRGIDDAAIYAYKLGIAKKQVTRYEGQKVAERKVLPCITIPYSYEQGYLQKYFIAPWLPKEERLNCRLMQDFGISARWWFTEKHPKGRKELWIVEGEWDAILLASQKGLNADVCTSTTGAGNVPNDLSDLDKYEKIYIWYDLDDAGTKGAEKLAHAIGKRASIATVPHPDNHKSGYDVGDAILGGFTIADFEKAKQQAISKTGNQGLKSRLVSTAELMARAKDYTDWLIEDLLPINELILLAASPRAGKSLMAMNIAQCVASGSNFLDRPVTQGNVIYVQCEDSETKTKQRAIAQGWDEKLPVYWLDKFKLSELPELIELAKELEPRLIVLDTLSRVRDDAIGESSAEMGRILEPLQEFAREFNCCVLPVHHTGKIKADNADSLDIFDTIRGSSAIRATCRGTLVIAAGENGYRLCAENGYGKQDLEIHMNLATLTWKLIGRWNVTANQSQSEQILDFLNKVGSANIDEIATATSLPKASIYVVLSRLTHDNVISKIGSRKGVQYVRANLKNVSNISNMLDTVLDAETHTQSELQDLSNKKTFISPHEPHTLATPVSSDSNLLDTHEKAGNPSLATDSESNNLSNKAQIVRYDAPMLDTVLDAQTNTQTGLQQLSNNSGTVSNTVVVGSFVSYIGPNWQRAKFFSNRDVKVIAINGDIATVRRSYGLALELSLSELALLDGVSHG